MIISHGRRYIFVHIPKTGGTSLSLALESRAMKDDVLIGDTPKAKNRRGRLKGVKTAGRLWKHSTIRDVYGLVTQEQLDEYFVFAMVRNPWDRMVSYYHWLHDQSFDHPAVKLAKAMEFSGFLNHPLTRDSVVNNPYGSYVKDAKGRDAANLYIRLEHFQEDVRLLEDHLGMSLGELPSENASSRDNDYRQYYSPQDRDLVGEICADDIRRFEYQFQD